MPETTEQAQLRILGLPYDHIDINPHEGIRCDRAGCMWCDGGLFVCRVCGSFEGATTTQCPKRGLTKDETDRVYAGTLDYRDGRWIDGQLSVHAPGGYVLLLD